MAKNTAVLIVGAGPAGIATAACLNRLSIPNVVLEKENCCASLWKNRSYERLKLHLAKQYCQLPHMPFPPRAPTFVSRRDFITYLDDYAAHFRVSPLYGRSVESASYEDDGRWRLTAKNVASGEVEVYMAEFLVVATGENSEGKVPKVEGMEGFRGEVLHSYQYGNGERFRGKDVLVVGCGNSGMEIALDLSNWGARSSISTRNPVHVLTKEMVHVGMCLMELFPCAVVDKLLLMMSKMKYGHFSRYGLQKPTKGPFHLKRTSGRSPVIDVGTMYKIRTREIKVLPSMTKVKGDNNIEFASGKTEKFEAIIFATGYQSTVRKWFKAGEDLFNEDGMPKQRAPNHWKGKNGLYCAGFARGGLFGISNDAQNIAKDVHNSLSKEKNEPPAGRRRWTNIMYGCYPHNVRPFAGRN